LVIIAQSLVSPSPRKKSPGDTSNLRWEEFVEKMIVNAPMNLLTYLLTYLLIKPRVKEWRLADDEKYLTNDVSILLFMKADIDEELINYSSFDDTERTLAICAFRRFQY